MPYQLEITPAQREASDRHDVREVVYLLSGTLPGRHGVPDLPIYWATREVAAPLGVSGADVRFDAYLGPPQQVTRAMGFEAGSQGSTPPIRVPVRNLPLAHSESMVAAILDDDYSLENATVTLRVGYVRPGQRAEDLASGDWTPLALDGFLGPAQDVQLDGLVLEVHSRGARRNQAMSWPQMPAADTSTVQLDRKDAGRFVPVVVGKPDGWMRPLTLDVGVRGNTVSGYNAGDTVIQFRNLTVGPEFLLSGNAPSGLVTDNPGGGHTGLACIMVHYRTPTYLVTSASYDPEGQVFTVQLNSGLAAAAPRGAMVQQYGGANGSQSYRWCFAGFGDPEGAVQAGWLFSDGTIRAARPREVAADDVWPFNFSSLSLEGVGGKDAGAGLFDAVVITLPRGVRGNPAVPLFWDPLLGGGGQVTQQPEFQGSVRADAKPNYPTGGTGTDNANARDGSEATFAGLSLSDVIILTFNSAPSPFADGDTTASTLWVQAFGSVDFRDVTGGTLFGSINAAPSGLYRFTQVSPRDFNETVRCVGQTGGGGVIELWWEHDLLTSGALTRTADVVVGGASGAVGEELQFAELVVRFPAGSLGATSFVVSGGSAVTSPWRELETISGLSNVIPYPSAVFGGLHVLLGEEGDIRFINQSSYGAAHAKFMEEDIRLNFVLEEPLPWSELETEIGKQGRCHAFYGPSGHELLFMETESGYESRSTVQEFRLPGCPGSNTFSSEFARTLTSELVNVVDVTWHPDYLTGNRQGHVLASAQESVADVGVRKDARGVLDLWMHSPWPGHPTYSGEAVASELAEFHATRQAFARSRFSFETAWPAHGVDRGSVIRVSYPVSSYPPSFRNVLCEVEEITAAPLNAERFRIVARSIGKPQKGLSPAYIWSDVFTLEADAWTSRLLQEFDVWDDYWSVSG